MGAFFVLTTVYVVDPTRVRIEVFVPIALVALGFICGIRVGGNGDKKGDEK